MLRAQPAAEALIPIEHFTRHDEFGTIKISPDGEFIAATTGRYGRADMLFLSLKEKKVVGIVKSPDRFEIGPFHWVSPTRVIYYLAERFPGRARPSLTGEIYAINRDARNQKLIYGYRAGTDSMAIRTPKAEPSFAYPVVISTLKDDPDHILIAEFAYKLQINSVQFNPDARPVITRLNVQTGKKQKLGTAPLANATVLVDNEDRVRYAIGLNEQMKLAVTWKPQADGPWKAFALPGFREESVRPLQFDAEGNSALFTGVSEGESLSSLHRMDLLTRKIEKLHAFPETDIEDAVFDFSQREVVGVWTQADRPTYHWLAVDHPASLLHRSLQRAFPGQIVSVISATEDGSLAIILVNSDVNPGDFYLFDTRSKGAAFLKAARQWINPDRMRPAVPIRLNARDGVPLQGYLVRPPGDGPHPLVILPHGGPHDVRDFWQFDWEAQLFANRGYAVLKVNFRGSGGYGMDFLRAGYREWGGRMQDDLTDATRWAIEQGIANKDRVCIYGASYGGYAALMGAVREPGLYRCAIGYVGVYDLEFMWESGDIPDSRSGRSYLEKVLGNDPKELRARSPAHNAQSIEIPVLLIHGKIDWRADYDHAKRMRDALEKLSKPVEWMALDREGHGVYDDESRREVYGRILAFLDRHLGDSAAAAH